MLLHHPAHLLPILLRQLLEEVFQLVTLVLDRLNGCLLLIDALLIPRITEQVKQLLSLQPTKILQQILRGFEPLTLQPTEIRKNKMPVTLPKLQTFHP
jgi:hypothetical protein